MADSLRRLVNIGTFTVLQGKLERWLDSYYANSCDSNVARCCEIIELNAKVQGQLYKLLSVTAEAGGLYGGTSVIKSRLLPFLGSNFFTTGGSVTADSSLSVLAEAASKNRELDELQEMYDKTLNDLEVELEDKKAELQDVRDELIETKEELNRNLRTSSSEKMLTEVETRELRRKLALAEEEVRNLRSKAGLLTDYDTQVRRLRDDIALLTARRDSLYRSTTSLPFSKDDSYTNLSLKDETQKPSRDKSGLANSQDEIVKLRAKSGLVDDYQREVRNLRNELSLMGSKKSYLDSRSSPRKQERPRSPKKPERDINSSLSSYHYTPRLASPLSLDDTVQRVRQQNLISRWNDMFAQDRLDAMDTLRRYSDDYENNQRIIFLVMQEAFSVAKTAFGCFKRKVRSNLAVTHIGPETLEEAVQDYINRNTDLYDLPGMVADVIRALNRSPKIFLPPDCSFAIIQPFCREACKVAWQMSALAHPLDTAVATDAELFDCNKYRRSYDSEYTAPLVNHHIWPALMQGARVIMKGEAVTRRGASLGGSTSYLQNTGSARRSRSPTRSLSPSARTRSRSRSLSPTRRARSRSPSPIRRSPYTSDPLY